MLSPDQLDEVERLILQTMPSYDFDEMLKDIAQRVRDYLTGLNMGDGT
jgi:hypothetical protein